MKKVLAAALAALFAVNAYAGVAILVGQRMGQSVTGGTIWICTYTYFGRTFEQGYAGFCPSSVEVQ